MKRSFTRIGLIAATMIATVGLIAAPASASAIPSGIGWAGSWSYTSATALSVQVAVPGASVSATGSDSGGTRTFTVSLSDTSSSDGKCATVEWESGSSDVQTSACNTTVQFTPPTTSDSVLVTVCRQASGGAKTNCNPLDVPSSLEYPFLSVAGNGFNWYYYTQSNPYITEDWAAYLTIGSVDFDYFGTDNFGGSGKRWIEPYLTLLNQTTSCGSGQIYSGTVASSLTLCGGDKIQELPTTTVTGIVLGQGCIWSTRTIIVKAVAPQSAQPVIKHCVVIDVPVPS
jgi:hypothetical protein